MKVAVIGAFGISNAGDNLIAAATKLSLGEIAPDLEIDIYSPKMTLLPSLDSEKNSMLNCALVNVQSPEFWEKIYAYDALIIGGGGVLVPTPNFDIFLLSGKHIDISRLPKKAWNAVCSQWTPLNDFALKEWYEKLKIAANSMDYIGVRSMVTKKLLEKVGCDPDKINVVPDPAVSFSLTDQSKISDSLRERYQLNNDDDIIGISVGREIFHPALKTYVEELGKALSALQKEGKKVIIFPFGMIYRDDKACKDLWNICPESKLIQDPLSMEEIWTMVGLCNVYLTVRYHGLIAALVNQVPALALDCYLSNDTASSKIRDFMTQNDLEEFYYSPMISVFGDPGMRSFMEQKSRLLSIGISKKINQLFSERSKDVWKSAYQIALQKSKLHFEVACMTLLLVTKVTLLKNTRYFNGIN